ncbi:MAG: 23S rRNA (uracil(1939)-C(5))-methyltransferase RlmD [Candidatus Omnitrophica bacterium]|nr:23S rRNA (uracil(1939)-C(5))-methyltransferase RlmD [Candidatus Omnitrophota bacterium]
MPRKAANTLTLEKQAFAHVEPPCQHFGICGGCTLQDLPYPAQLELKTALLAKSLTSLGITTPVPVQGLDEPWRYRNKMEFTFGTWDGELVLGLHARGSFWKIVDVQDCHLVPAVFNEALEASRRCARATRLPAYNPHTHQGFFRYLTLRHSRLTNTVVACLITAPPARPEPIAAGGGDESIIRDLAAQMQAAVPSLASVYWGVNRKLADVAVPDELTLISGSATFEEQIGPFRLSLHPFNFLQPHLLQAERIYDTIRGVVRVGSGEVAWDLYCGVGVISLYLGALAGRVLGIESDPHNINLARLNAERAGLTHLEYRQGKVEELLRDRNRSTWLHQPAVIVVDPPRSGLHKEVQRGLVAAFPRQIVYLSCNAQTLVADLRQLLTMAPQYRLAHCSAYDMFPQTSHVETLVVLER